MRRYLPAALSSIGSILLWCQLSAAASPGIVLQKLTNGFDANLPTGPVLMVGDPVLWTYVVTNIGDVQLTSVTVTDDRGVTVTCPKTVLEPGESMTCTGSGLATAGQYVNVGTAAASAGDVPVSDTDPSHFLGMAPIPAVAIEKLTNGEDADTAPGVLVVIGDPVVWSYQVWNEGTVTLENLIVTDDQAVTVTCPKTTLLSGESMTCVGTGTAEAGQYANIGTVVGFPVGGGDAVSASDPSHYFGVLGVEACGPGYWKNHTAAWPPTGYSPSQKVSTVFAQAVAYTPVANSTLAQALSPVRGGGLNGAAATLVRAGVAALLSASHPGVDYAWTPAQVLTFVDQALASRERTTMLQAASLLGVFNALECPLE